MKVYDLKFTDGKGCRFIAAQPEDTEQEELQGLHGIFGDRLVSMVRIVPPAPVKLPWKRLSESSWSLGEFVLIRHASGQFSCTWPEGEVVGGKDEVSAAVRANWRFGC